MERYTGLEHRQTLRLKMAPEMKNENTLVAVTEINYITFQGFDNFMRKYSKELDLYVKVFLTDTPK